MPSPASLQAPPADQPGAQPRRDLGVVAALAQRKAEARVRHRVRGKAAVARIAGEDRRVAQVLGALAAIGTDAAGGAEPRHADALAEREAADALADRRDAADDLVPRHDRQLGVLQLAIDDVQVGAADAAGGDLDQQLPRPRLRQRPFPQDQRGPRAVEHHGAHDRHSGFQSRGRHPRSEPMRTDIAQPIRLEDYRQPDWLVDTVHLDVSLHPSGTRVRAKLALRPNPQVPAAPLVLDGDGLSLTSLKIDGAEAAPDSYVAAPERLSIPQPPNQPFTLEIETLVDPSANTQLSGLYRSSGTYCTQCEAEGFRRITYFPDRPDVMAVYTTRIEADKAEAPVLLANGNLTDSGDLPGGRHFAVWHDPHPKPAYLFALVGGDLAHIEDRFRTMSGRDVTLRIYVEHGKEDRCGYAMDALKRSMRWDEQAFGREYDLDIFMIVAVSDFNMGAMENKGLNVFNDKYVLATPETATDADYAAYRGDHRPRILPQLDRQPHHLPRLVPALPEGRPHRLPRPGILLRHALAAGEAHRRRAGLARRAVRRGRGAAGASGAAAGLQGDQQLLHEHRLREGRRAGADGADAASARTNSAPAWISTSPGTTARRRPSSSSSSASPT